MNIWERYPTKGTHYEAMKMKQLKTYEYTCYLGRDRDDWSEGQVEALTLDDAVRQISAELYGTGYTLKGSSVKVVDSQ